MATRLEDEFDPTRINAPDAAYPAGSLKDETTPGVSDDGTPLASRVGNDWQGFSQSALDKAGIAANGQPDSLSNPQILQAIEQMYNDGDSQLAVGPIWPLSSQGFASNGDNVNAKSLRVNTLGSGNSLFEMSGGQQSGVLSLLSEPSDNSNFGTVRVDGVISNLIPLNYLDNLSPSLLASSMSARVRPNIKPLFDRVIDEIKASNTYFKDSRTLGYQSSGLVCVPEVSGSGVVANPDIIFLVPIADTETYDFSVTFSGSSSKFVSLIGSDTLDGNYVTITSSIPPSGDTYSANGTSSGTYDYLGFRVRHDDAVVGTSSIITALSMTVNSSQKVDFDDLYSSHNATLNVAADNLITSSDQFFGDLYMRSLGVVTGNSPAVLWVANYATPVDPGGSALTRDAKGQSIDNPATINDALAYSQSIVDSGFKRPIIAMLAGNYDASLNAQNAAIRADRLTGDDCYIIAPYGRVIFTANGVLAGIFDNSNPGSDLYIYNLEFDDTFDIPIKCFARDLYALRCKTNSGTAASGFSGDGWELDDNNFILQECEATGSGNDGFNHHGFGHGVLVDCNGYNNEDDGFSPHDKCTYEVWGGEYYGNGKGNITPAFGAQGICVGVQSYDQQKSGPNVADFNYGGFVCLSGVEQAGNEERPTIMILVDCSSNNDYIGINSCGSKSYTILSSNTVTDSIEEKIAQKVWNFRGTGAIMEIDNQTLTGSGTNREITNITRYRIYKPQIGGNSA